VSKLLTPEQAVSGIRDGATLAVTGFRWAGSPEVLLRALGERFARTGHPRGLTLVFSSAAGDSISTGLEHLAAPGLLRRVVGGFWGVTPRLAELARTGAIEAYNFPQGQIARLYGAIASGMPGLLSRIGVGTYIDPRQGGGRLNDITPADLVEVVTIRGEEWLLYHAFPIDVAFARGSSSDPIGNVSMEREALTTEAMSAALAAHNSRGQVFVQVLNDQEVVHPRAVAIPGFVVDGIVLAGDPALDHRQCVESVFDASLTGDATASAPSMATPSLKLVRKIIASRAMRELHAGDVVNLGQGIPSDIPTVLRGTPLDGTIHFTIESGVAGGSPRPVPDFGIADSPQAIIRQDDQFTFYNGGGLDVAFLGFAEADALGNVNASHFRGRAVGCGGFLDIAYPARRLVFCGTFTAGDLDVAIEDGRLSIRNEGRVPKFVRQLQQLMFNASRGRAGQQPALFVTERCVFEICADGIRLVEIAPGIDLQLDVLDRMEFRPALAVRLRDMPLPS